MITDTVIEPPETIEIHEHSNHRPTGGTRNFANR
jgi:hypothetical protein